MIVLDQPSKKMEVVLAGAVTTSQLDVNCYYFDQYPQAQTQPRNGHNYVATNSTTDVTAVAAPGLVGIRRNVFSLSVYNKDSAQATVTVKIDDGGSERILVKQTLNAGDSLNYEHGAGWTFTTPVSVPFTDTLNLVKGSADATKQLRIEVDGLTTNTTRVWTAPDADLTVVGTATTQTLTNKTLTSPTINTGDLGSASIAGTQTAGDNSTKVATTAYVDATTGTLSTEQSTASGGTKDFTSIPATTKEIEVMFVGVSLSGTSTIQVRIGDSGGIEATGYNSSSANLADTGAVSATRITTGFLIYVAAATQTVHGILRLVLEDASDNTWVAYGNFSRGEADAIIVSAGSKSLSGTLDRLSIVSGNGTDTFDAGVVNIRYR